MTKSIDTQHTPFTLISVIERGVVVQLVRTPACHAGGREFESRPSRQLQVPSDLFLRFSDQQDLSNLYLQKGYQIEESAYYGTRICLPERHGVNFFR